MRMRSVRKVGLASVVAWLGLGMVDGPSSRPTLARDDPPAAGKAGGRRLPDVAGPPQGVGPFFIKRPARDPNAPKPDLDAAPKEVAVEISGVVRDLHERPVDGATVYALGIQIVDDPKPTMTTKVVATTTTAGDGSYTFAGVKVPTSRDRHSPQALTPYVRFKVVAKATGSGLGWHRDETMNAIDPPDPDDIQGHWALGTPAVMNVYLRPEADLKGRVVDERGQPVAGVKVDLHDVNLMDEEATDTTFGINMLAENWPGGLGRAVTDEDGRFRLPGLPSESCCWISFERPDSKGSKWLYASTLAEAATKHGQPRVHNGRGPHEVYPRDMTVTMPSTRSVEVRVVADDDGQAVANVRVSSFGDNLATGTVASGVSDARGLVTLDLPAGRYRGLYADPDSRGSRFIRTYLRPLEVAAEPKVQKLELRMKPGFEILLEAVDEDTGRPIPNIPFEIRPEKSDQDWTTLSMSTFQGIGQGTGPDGKFRALIAPTPGKTYRVRVFEADRGDPNLPPPPRVKGRDAPASYDAAPNMSDTFEAASGKSVSFRFLLKKQ